jgi:hypothetical protein
LFVAFGNANANNPRMVYSGVLCQRKCPPLYYLARPFDVLAVFSPERVEPILVYVVVRPPPLPEPRPWKKGELIEVPSLRT